MFTCSFFFATAQAVKVELIDSWCWVTIARRKWEREKEWKCSQRKGKESMADSEREKGVKDWMICPCFNGKDGSMVSDPCHIGRRASNGCISYPFSSSSWLTRYWILVAFSSSPSSFSSPLAFCVTFNIIYRIRIIHSTRRFLNQNNAWLLLNLNEGDKAASDWQK